MNTNNLPGISTHSLTAMEKHVGLHEALYYASDVANVVVSVLLLFVTLLACGF